MKDLKLIRKSITQLSIGFISIYIADYIAMYGLSEISIPILFEVFKDIIGIYLILAVTYLYYVFIKNTAKSKHKANTNRTLV